MFMLAVTCCSTGGGAANRVATIVKRAEVDGFGGVGGTAGTAHLDAAFGDLEALKRATKGLVAMASSQHLQAAAKTNQVGHSLERSLLPQQHHHVM